jgi:hypothetical protein
MCLSTWISTLKDIILAIAAIVTATVAALGLKKWCEELRGRADFDVARGLIRATYKVRTNFNQAECPWYGPPNIHLTIRP